MKRISILVSCLFILMLSSCGTVEGIGKDIERGGSAIKNAASK